MRIDFYATMGCTMNTGAHILLENAEYDFLSKAALEHELRELDAGAAVVDFSNVSYIDSSALTTLITTLKRMRSNDPGSTIALKNVRPTIRRIFELTALTNLFNLE